MTGAEPKSADLIATEPTTPRYTVTARTDSMDVVLEGTATRVTGDDIFQRMAQACRFKYW